MKKNHLTFSLPLSFLFILLSCSFAMTVNALPASQQSTGPLEATAGCANCSEPPKSGLTELPILQVEATERIKELDRPYICPADVNAPDCILIRWLNWKHSSYPQKCQNFFLDDQGKLGNFSKMCATMMLEDIKREGEKSLLLIEPPEFTEACPNFKNLSLIQKVAFHCWVFELTAFPESSCDVKTNPGTGVTDKAVCLYQLNQLPVNRYWRSKDAIIRAGQKTKYCAVDSVKILELENCTGCAFDEYKRKIKHDKTPFGYVNSKGERVNGAYWASHTKLSEQAKKCMMKYMDKEGKEKMVRDPNNSKRLIPQWLRDCKGANSEWGARWKFFGRLPRFPLCQNPSADSELTKLKAYEQKEAEKAGAK